MSLIPSFYNGFEPLLKMPTGRLQDILDKLNNQKPHTGGTTVLNSNSILL